MASHAERFGDALQSIIETAESNGVAKSDLIEALESAIENLMTETPDDEEEDQ